MPRTLIATRYVTPLREGGSLPAVVEADDDGLYVLKFRGAGQGTKALVAELVAGEIGRTLGLLVPEIVFMQVDPALGRSEPDFEIQALLKASAGLNLALDFLPGALAYSPAVASQRDAVDAELASAVVWFDALVTNVDRTARNTNLLLWHRRLWLIDHGAALYFHHSWANLHERSQDRFPAVKDHVLLPQASGLEAADTTFSARVSPERIRAIIATIPDDWLDPDAPFLDAEAQREAYITYLLDRLRPPRAFVEEALNARAKLV